MQLLSRMLSRVGSGRFGWQAGAVSEPAPPGAAPASAAPAPEAPASAAPEPEAPAAPAPAPASAVLAASASSDHRWASPTDATAQVASAVGVAPPPGSSPLSPYSDSFGSDSFGSGGGSGAWHAGAPLGGVVPPPAPAAPPAARRDVLLTAILLVAALAAGATSLLSWRDLGRLNRGTETGWTEFDGGLGRGWVAVLGGVLLAVAGVLVAADKGRAGRVLATLTGVGLMIFSVLEWGLGLRMVRSGPGPGLWMLFGVGMIVVVAVGILVPDRIEQEPER